MAEAVTLPKIGYIYLMVDTNVISRETFRDARRRVRHKQESLAMALGCSLSTIQNFERGKTTRMYSVRWTDLVRELGIRVRDGGTLAKLPELPN